MSWKDDALELQAKGLNHIQICDKLFDEIDAPNRDAAIKRIRRIIENTDHKNIDIIENLEPAEYAEKWHGNQTIKFALIGDTHINSKYTQLTYLHTFYDICEKENIPTVYHTGDIDDGEQMHPGHQYECYNQGSDEHVNEIVEVYPSRPNIKTYFITGNHDASIYKKCGTDIGRMISNYRSDMIYLGRDCAIIHLTRNCPLETRNPWDGTTSALSYKIQKLINSINDEDKPDILAVGHYHKTEQLFYSGIHAFQTGTFCAQTPFMKGKSISASMGGWICEADVDASGKIVSLKTQLIPFYKPIQNDYRSFR